MLCVSMCMCELLLLNLLGSNTNPEDLDLKFHLVFYILLFITLNSFT